MIVGSTTFESGLPLGKCSLIIETNRFTCMSRPSQSKFMKLNQWHLLSPLHVGQVVHPQSLSDPQSLRPRRRTMTFVVTRANGAARVVAFIVVSTCILHGRRLSCRRTGYCHHRWGRTNHSCCPSRIGSERPYKRVSVWWGVADFTES